MACAHDRSAPGSRSAPAPRLSDWHCIAILLTLTALLFRKALFSSQVILSHPVFLDLTHSLYAWRKFGFSLLRQGVIPLWNPYSFCGTPFVANWHSAVFYPPNLIFLFLPAHEGINWSIAFHFFLAAALTYAFMRYLVNDRPSALLSGLVFVFSGPYIVQLFPGHVFNPLPWLPLSFLIAEIAIRKGRIVYYVVCGIVLALQILAGHPQYAFYCLGALVLYILCRASCACNDEKSLKPLGVACIGLAILLAVGFSLSAVQLFPSLEFTAQSSRALLKGPESVRDISFPPENLATLLAPGFWGDMHGVRYWGRWLLWETCIYVGILPLVLAIAGALLMRNRYTYFFLGLAALSLLLSFGAYSPLFDFLYYHVPGFNLFRGQAKFIFLTAFSLAVLAGYGCSLITRLSERKRALVYIAMGAIVLTGAVFLICVLLSTGGGEQSPLWNHIVQYRELLGFEGTPPLSRGEGMIFSSAYHVVFKGLLIAGLWLAVSGILLYAIAGGWIPCGIAAILIVVISLTDLWSFGAKYIMVSPLAACYWPSQVTEALKADSSFYRVCSPNIAVPGTNQNINEDIYAIDGYETNNVGAYKEYVDYSQGASPAQQLTFSINKITPMLEALNLKYILFPSTESFVKSGYNMLFRESQVSIYERVNPAPRAYIVHDALVIADGGEALSGLAKSGHDPARVVVLDRDPGVPMPAAGPQAGEVVEITSYSPNSVVVRARLSMPGFLVLKDVFYPGWKAYVDGRERPIRRADYAFRAVYCEGGRHVVQFNYEPRSFVVGARVSVGSAVLVMLWLLFAAVLSGGYQKHPRPNLPASEGGGNR